MNNLFTVLTISIVLYMNVFTASQTGEELTGFFSFIEENRFQIEEWKIYNKGDAGIVGSSEEFYDFVRKLEATASVKEWKYETVRNHHYKVTGVANRDGVRINLTILGVQKNGKIALSVNQEIIGNREEDYEGTSWITLDGVRTSKVFYTVTASKADQYSHEQMQYLTKRLMNEFSAEKLEELVEEDFISISTYSKEIKNDLAYGKKEKMNLQIAVRSLPNKVVLTVGSPIITTEY